MKIKVIAMLTLLPLAGSILLLGLAAADLWISSITPDERSQMGLET